MLTEPARVHAGRRVRGACAAREDASDAHIEGEKQQATQSLQSCGEVLSSLYPTLLASPKVLRATCTAASTLWLRLWTGDVGACVPDTQVRRFNRTGAPTLMLLAHWGVLPNVHFPVPWKPAAPRLKV